MPASGPLIIKGFGFDARQTILLNIPFGFVQAAVCVIGCLLAARFGYKGLVIIGFMIPCVLGAGLLYGLGRTPNYQGGLLFGYYCIGFLFGCNPLIFSWLAANTSGTYPFPILFDRVYPILSGAYRTHRAHEEVPRHLAMQRRLSCGQHSRAPLVQLEPGPILPPGCRRGARYLHRLQCPRGVGPQASRPLAPRTC
jgi:hypothetical protein